jgi:hypothetical protein
MEMYSLIIIRGSSDRVATIIRERIRVVTFFSGTQAIIKGATITTEADTETTIEGTEMEAEGIRAVVVINATILLIRIALAAGIIIDDNLKKNNHHKTLHYTH